MSTTQVAGDQATELLLGAAEGLGIDPSHPLASIVQGLVSGAVAVPRLATHPNELRQTVFGMFHAAPDIVSQIHTAYNNGDSAEIANGVGRLIALGGVLYGAGKGLSKAAKHIPEGMGVMPPEPPAGGFGKTRPPIPAHVQNLTDAVGKTNKIFVEDRFNDAVQSAFPALKASETPALGRSVKDLRDVATVAKHASTEAWKPYQTLLDSTTTPIDRLDILRQAGQNLPDVFKTTRAVDAKNIAGNWGRSLSKAQYSANEIEQAAQNLNAELKAYYQKNNLDRASASKIPATAGKEALLSAYRQLLDSTIEQDTGYDAAPLRTNYGNIKAVHNAVIESPSGDDTLFDTLTRNPSTLTSPKATATKAVLSKLVGQTPDQQAARAFRLFKPETPQTGLVHVPQPPAPPPGQPLTAILHEGPTGPPGGYPMPPVIRGLIPEKTSGVQGMISDRTATLTPPQPPESFSEALAREQTPQSRQLRQIMSKGPYDKQTAPVTAEEYLQSKGGTAFPPSSKSVAKTPKPIPPRKPGTK